MSYVVEESADEFESVRDELSEHMSVGWSSHGAVEQQASKLPASPEVESRPREIASDSSVVDIPNASTRIEGLERSRSSDGVARTPSAPASPSQTATPSSATQSPTRQPREATPAVYLTEIDKFIIRDLDAGRAYVATASPETSCHNGAVKQKLKDLATGTVQQFQYTTVGPDGSDNSRNGSDAGNASSPTADAEGRAAAEASTKPAGKSWLRGVFHRKGKQKWAEDAAAAGAAAAAAEDTDQRLTALLDGGASDMSSSFSGSVRSAQHADRASPESIAGCSGSNRLNVPGATRVYANKKVFREFTDVRHIQTLQGHVGVIWVLAFNDSATYMASAGDDQIIRIWQSTRAPNADRGVVDSNNAGSLSSRLHASSFGCLSDTGSSQRDTSSASGPSASIFLPTPVKQFVGHSKAVLDISWSGHFVLSASADKTVCMWHLQRDGPLKTFRHDTYVFAAVFHPVNGRHFASACIDGKLRVWRAADPPAVLDWKQTQSHSITCAAFSGGGDKVLTGMQSGRFRMYTVNRNFKLEYQAEVDVREKRKRRKDVQVSGIKCIAQRPDSVLVTSKDSRIRLYEGFRLAVKYKGLKNQQCRIAATFSPDGLYVICGSDSGSVYIWRTETEASTCLERPLVRSTAAAPESRVKNSSYEVFRAFGADSKCTVAAFVPVAAEPVSSKYAVSQQAMGSISQRSGVTLKEVLKERKADSSEAALQAASETAYTNACKLQAYGRVIVAAGTNGEIRVYDNLGFPSWM